MPSLLKFAVSLCLWITAGCVLSLAAVHGFWIGVWLFHSVAGARACDAVGQFILFPMRTIFATLGNRVDQSAPISEPFWYAISNGALLGIVGYFLRRRFKRNQERGGGVRFSA